MFWKGVEGDNTIWTSSLGPTDSEWQAQRQVLFARYTAGDDSVTATPTAIGSTAGPWAAVRDDPDIDRVLHSDPADRMHQIVLAWKGSAGDAGIWTAQTDGSAPFVSGQTGLGFTTATGPSIAKVEGRTFMAWKGPGDDNTLWWSRL